jgi:1,2-diacylglycerol 3-alpha-glucosyltransferase
MPETETMTALIDSAAAAQRCRLAVIWIDWYAYHIARFAGLYGAPGLEGQVCGIELVGGIGVHAGLKFRESLPAELPIRTLLPNSSWREAGQLRLALKLWHLLSELRPEALLIPGYYTLPAIAAALWCKVHRRTAIMMTESTVDDHPRSGWKERAKSLLIRTLFDWAVCGGHAHRRYLRLLGFRDDRIAGFYDVVDNDFYRRATAALRRPPRISTLPAHYFLFVGRLAAEKNVETLLASWIEYRNSGGTWALVLVGDGPLTPELRQIAAQSAFSDDVLFPGLRSSSELPEYYSFASCFVLPSAREPWGLVVNEAMASGLPVIVSNRCGCAEDLVVPDRNGFIFDPSNGPELTFQLMSMECMDPARRRDMGVSSSDLIRSYSPAAFGLEVSQILNLKARSKAMGT